MNIEVAATKPRNITTDILVFGLVGRGGTSEGWKALRRVLGGNPLPQLELEGWKGKSGDFVVFHAPPRANCRLIAVGYLANRGTPARGAIRDLANRVASKARSVGMSRVAFFLDPAFDGPRGIERWGYQEIGEGLGFGAYRFDAHLAKKAEHPPADTVYAYYRGRRDRDEVAATINEGLLIATAQNKARDLVNEPANVVNPESYVEYARALAEEHGLGITVLDREACAERNMNAFLAVGAGGGYEPHLVHLSWTPENATSRVALVGKAVTFDSGGLCIKTAAGQATMKMDMGGSAAVFGAIAAVAALKLPVEVHAIFAACENMTGSKAYHTGDIIKASNGKTIEVLNTDAEGRLTLADALHYAGDVEPDYIIDLATLTGACVVALGTDIAAVMGRSRQLVRGLLAAGERAGEPMWELPLPEDYKELLKSKQADLKNIGGRWGGAITAGLFLEEFVPEGPQWAHIDIAGPAWVDNAKPTRPYGGTGFPVRALVDWMRTL